MKYFQICNMTACVKSKKSIESKLTNSPTKYFKICQKKKKKMLRIKSVLLKSPNGFCNYTYIGVFFRTRMSIGNIIYILVSILLQINRADGQI